MNGPDPYMTRKQIASDLLSSHIWVNGGVRHIGLPFPHGNNIPLQSIFLLFRVKDNHLKGN